MFGLRYGRVVTLRRICVILTTFWCVALLGSTVYFWDYRVTFYYSYAFLSLCIITSITSYSKIFLTLRHQQTQVQANVQQEQPRRTFPLNIARYRKIVCGTLWLQLALCVCFLPYCVLEAFKTTNSSIFFARQCAFTLAYFNSSLNPILYCWKIREVRRAMKNTISQLFCC